MKANCCKLCGATFICDNGKWFTTCNCAKDRPSELVVAQKEWDASRAPSLQDPAPANHASVCMGCAEPLETEPADELLGLCHRCSEGVGMAMDAQEGRGR